MSPDAQRIAIAEACGWFDIKRSEGFPPHLIGQHPNLQVPEGCCLYRRPIPDYLNDLNAMHEAEKVLVGWLGPYGCERLTPDAYHHYELMLYRVFRKMPKDAYVHWSDLGGERGLLCSTAAQRAEAFLKTLNLWKP